MLDKNWRKKINLFYSKSPLFHRAVGISPLCCDFRFLDVHSRSEMLYKISVLKHFAKFTGKHQCQSIFLKETLAPLFCCEFCKISKNTFFTEHLRAAASLSKYVSYRCDSYKNSIFVYYKNSISPIKQV